MTTTENINLSFRSKFIKMLNDENRQRVMNAFGWFCNLGQNKASNFLWKMTYKEEDFRLQMLKEMGLEENDISKESICMFRNELRFQYERSHQNCFSDVVIPDECREAYKALLRKADIITAKTVFEHCKSCNGAPERILYLLENEKENYYYGGIRSLNFYPDEAAYLKPFHKQIYDLFKAWEDYIKESGKPLNTPFAELDKFVKEQGVELTDGEQKEKGEELSEPCQVPGESKQEAIELQQVQGESKQEELQVGSEFKLLTPSEISAHEEIFESFVETGDLNILVKIAELGFDLNVVNAKKEEIYDYLQREKIVTTLSEALEMAKENRDSAIKLLLEE